MRLLSSEMTLLETAITSLRLGDLNQSWSAAQRGIELSCDRRDTKEFWEYRFVYAEVLRIRGHFEGALGYLEALGLPSGQDSDIYASQEMHRGYCSGLLGRHEASKQLLRRAEKRAGDAGLWELRCEVLLRQAMVSYLQGDYASSGRIYRVVLEECKKFDSWYIHSMALIGVGKVLMIQRHFADAVPWFQEALAIVERMRANYAKSGIWEELAVCELGMGNSAKALKLLQDAERINLELGAMPCHQICVANIGNVYFVNGDYLTAISHYERALKIARETKDPVSIQKWSHNIEFAFSKLREQTAKVASAVK